MKLFFFLLNLFVLEKELPVAGSGNAYLTCRDAKKNIVFTAETLQVSDGLVVAEVREGDSTIAFFDYDNTSIVFDPVSKVYTLSIKSAEQSNLNWYLMFWAVPSTFKTIKASGGHWRYQFKGKIKSTNPADKKSFKSFERTLDCILEYKI